MESKNVIKGNIVAKMISCNDSDHMWDHGYERPGLCPICHNVIEFIPNLEYKVRKNKNRDLMVTYDGFHIASQKFKDFCDENGYDGLKFVQFPKSPKYYFFYPQKIYQLDYVRRKTTFGGHRSCCGLYDEVIGCLPAYKHPNNSVEGDDFICRTEFYFGGGLNATPFIIIGKETFEKMLEFGLSGFHCYNVYE